MKMYCPLMSYRRNSSLSVHCEKDACMWWDDANNDCLIASYLKNKIAESFQFDTQAVASAWYDPEEDDIIEDEDDWTLTTTNILGNYGIDKL